jgi:hypothetical protein
VHASPFPCQAARALDPIDESESVHVLSSRFTFHERQTTRRSAQMKNGFFRGHGLGNDYVVMDPTELTFKLTPGKIRGICDRHWGLGSDGILALVPSKKADFGLRIYNPDGSEAEKSGNGLRIFARYLHATGKTKKASLHRRNQGGPSLHCPPSRPPRRCRCRYGRNGPGDVSTERPPLHTHRR